MSGLFSIPISGLKEGRRLYEFEVGNGFFEGFEESEIKEGNLSVNIILNKRSSHFELDFKISGKVKVCCDRCLEMFFQPVECENRLLVKYGKERDDSDPDLLVITAEEYELDVRQYIYEFILLALPIQKVHPGGSSENECNPEMIKKLREHIVSEDKATDPRWDELKKLMNNN